MHALDLRRRERLCRMIMAIVRVHALVSRAASAAWPDKKREPNRQTGLFYTYRLNNCAAPAPASYDVLVVEEEVFLCARHAKEATTKTLSLSGAGAAQLFNRLYIQKRLIACTSDLHHSTQRPEHYEK